LTAAPSRRGVNNVLCDVISILLLGVAPRASAYKVCRVAQ
jgi:hypothetical protein